MAGSVNRVTILGNLGIDPEIRTFQNGGKVCNLRIATSEHWKDKQSGERKERTEWHSVAVFQEGLVRICEQYLKKGSKVYIEGKLQTRKWQDQSGADRYTTEIVLQGYDGALTMLDGPSNGTNNYDRGSSHDPYAPSSHGGYDQSPEGYNAGGRPSNDIQDSIPFSAEWRI